MTNFRKIAEFPLPPSMTVHALGAASCVLARCADDGPPLWQVWTLDGRCLSGDLVACPAGDWTLPCHSYDGRHTWGVVHHGRGRRSQTRVDEWARPLTLPEKIALADTFALRVPAPALLGVLYSIPLYDVTVSERWLLREVGVACALVGQPDADYEVRPLRLFHPAAQDTSDLITADCLALEHPSVLLCRGDTLLAADEGRSPRVVVWSVSHA